MADVELAEVAGGVVTALVAAMALVADGRLGAPARIYTPDTVPNEPVEPYAVIDMANPGFGWDAGLDTGGSSGLSALQVTGVGRLVESSRWVCDVVRSYLRQLDPTTVSAGGDTHIKLVSSQGPPVGPIEAGTLANSVETYDLYVEAS